MVLDVKTVKIASQTFLDLHFYHETVLESLKMHSLFPKIN